MCSACESEGLMSQHVVSILNGMLFFKKLTLGGVTASSGLLVLLLLFIPYLSGIIFHVGKEPLNHTDISSSYQNSH